VTLRMRTPFRLAAAARRFAANQSAATAVEYAVMTFIAIAIVAAISQLGAASPPLYEQVQGIFN
jgi:Flp pilus assembly pilin Flp